MIKKEIHTLWVCQECGYMSPIEITTCPECEDTIVVDYQAEQAKQIDAAIKKYDALVTPTEFENYIKMR